GRHARVTLGTGTATGAASANVTSIVSVPPSSSTTALLASAHAGWHGAGAVSRLLSSSSSVGDGNSLAAWACTDCEGATAASASNAAAAGAPRISPGGTRPGLPASNHNSASASNTLAMRHV